MYDNKILVNIYILSLDKNYEVYIPYNEKVGNISKLLNCTMFDSIDFTKNYRIYNIESGIAYNSNDLLKNTDIKNGSRLMLV